MKRLLLTLSISLTLTLTSYAQFGIGASIELINGLVGATTPQVSYDPISEAQMAQQLAETKKNADLIKQQIELLEQTTEKLAKVSNWLSQVTVTQDIILIEKKIFDISRETLEFANNTGITYHKKVIAAVNGINTLLIGVTGTLEITSDLLKDNLVEINTAERLQLLRSYRSEAYGQLSTARHLRNLVIEVGTFKTIDHAYGNIEKGNNKIIGN